MKKLQGMILIICLMVIIGCDQAGISADSTSRPRADATDSDFAARRKRLGREEKFRIMVDKVLVVETSDYRMTEGHVRTLAGAGFNVVVPRGGAGDIKDVRRMARLARKHNVFYMPWMGHMPRTSILAGESEKIVWNSGVVQDRCSPNSEKFWSWMTRRIIAYAKISKDNPALIGVFLDFENYGAYNIGRWVYELSYDTTILAEFAKSRGIKIPSLKPKRRIAWLEENKLHEAFRKFQVARWRSRCRKLRRQVDAIDPKFQFFIYPNVHYTLFMREAAFREWGTKAAPVVVADYHNYYLPPDAWGKQAVSEARWNIIDAARWVKGHAERCGVEAMVIGGMDPVSDKPMDPEYHGRNAAAIADHSSGYWIFYEFKAMKDKSGRRIVPPVNADFLKWWGRANRAIVAGRARQFWQADRETPEVAGPPILVSMEGPGLASVILESPGEDAEIRYTVDGSKPKSDSTKYTGTIRITKTTTIQAVAFRAGKQIGSVSKRTVQVPLRIIEAESASLVRPWVVRTEGKGLRKYILVPKDGKIDLNDPENGALKYRFEAPEAGKYRLAFLLKGPWGSENSLLVKKTESGPLMDWYAMTHRREGWFWYLYPGSLDLRQGTNTITIRPKFVGATLDKIAIISPLSK